MPVLPFLPDLALLALALAILTAEVLARKHAARRTSRVAAGGFLALLVLLAAVPVPPEGAAFAGYRVTPSGVVWKQIFALAALAAVLFARSSFRASGSARGALERPGAFHGLIAFCTLGMFAVVSARDLLTFYLALELATLPLYALTALQPRDTAAVEAGSKYVLLGAFASALSLFGISFLYGAAGGLGFGALQAAAAAGAAQPLLLAGVLLVTASLGFKLAAAPFHMWAPDVYEGAPVPVAAFLSTGSKAAAVAAFAVLFLGPLEPLRPGLSGLFVGAAILSLLLGSLGALRQQNLVRFVAYSSVAQAGYMLMAFTGESGAARAALQYNLLVYGVSVFALFLVIGAVGRGAPQTLSSLRGLVVRSPLLTVLLVLGLFSLIGIPPLAGFLGKFLLFSVAAQAGQYGLVLAGGAAVAVSFYYYMRLLREAFLTGGETGADALAPLELGSRVRFAAVALSVLLVLLGVWPGLLEYVTR